jgi:hypothetical protein
LTPRPGGWRIKAGTWETGILPLPLAHNYAPPAHNRDSETHERNRRRAEVASAFPGSITQEPARFVPSPVYHLNNTPTPPISIFKSLQIISESPSKPGITGGWPRSRPPRRMRPGKAQRLQPTQISPENVPFSAGSFTSAAKYGRNCKRHGTPPELRAGLALTPRPGGWPWSFARGLKTDDRELSYPISEDPDMEQTAFLTPALRLHDLRLSRYTGV